MKNIYISWHLKQFGALSVSELYNILQLRNAVFVVEQNCVYQDADGKDRMAYHLYGMDDGKLLAYTRLLPPGISYAEASIGRVVVSPGQRNSGLGRQLMEESIKQCVDLFNAQTIRIGAQVYLRAFYQSLGFVQTGDEYMEDGIPHIEMLLNK